MCIRDRDRAQTSISRGESNAYQSVSQIATAMRLHHLINHLLSQGCAASKEFLHRLSSGERSTTKSTRGFLRDPRISGLISSLEGMGEAHSKIGAVRRLVRERLSRDPESRVIVFATFRDTVSALELALSEIKGARPVRFVGQSNRDGSEGLTAKQQVERLDEFRDGSANVLVATSVGEEGLDIPSADLVIFYEPVTSEIRTIQRRGRTGRHREGEVVVLIAEETRDEGAWVAAERREEHMRRAVHRVRREIARGAVANLSNLSKFEIKSDEGSLSAIEFITSQREMHRVEISEMDDVEIDESRPSSLPPETFRATGQTGLEQFLDD